MQDVVAQHAPKWMLGNKIVSGNPPFIEAPMTDARALLSAWVPEYLTEEEGDRENLICDAISDLIHLSHAEGFVDVLDQAISHFLTAQYEEIELQGRTAAMNAGAFEAGTNPEAEAGRGGSLRRLPNQDGL